MSTTAAPTPWQRLWWRGAGLSAVSAAVVGICSTPAHDILVLVAVVACASVVGLTWSVTVTRDVHRAPAYGVGSALAALAAIGLGHLGPVSFGVPVLLLATSPWSVAGTAPLRRRIAGNVTAEERSTHRLPPGSRQASPPADRPRDR